ncbi:MAG: YeeE/YedE thiosulfate transporter family protein [Bacillota bacterium]
MSSSQTTLRTQPRTRPTRQKRNQVGYGLAVIAACAVIGILLGGIKAPLAIKWLFGIAFGFVLQRSRFCFTASLRDPVLTGSTSITRAVIIAFILATIGFSALQIGPYLAGQTVPGNINPVGIHTAVGATMFGIGMVIAGGCASGTLMRMGEGFLLQWLVIIFFVAGSLLGAFHFGWWETHFIASSPNVFLPQVLGYPLAFFGQLVLLGLLYLLALRWEYRKL